MNKTIKYIGYYDTILNDTDKRAASPAARTKMEYIYEVLLNIGYAVEIISMAHIDNESSDYRRSRSQILKENLKVVYTPSIGRKNKLASVFRIIWSNIWLIYYLLKTVRKDDNVLVYHSLGTNLWVYLAWKLIKFNLILEVEEIYTDVIKKNTIEQFLELFTIKNADTYIFSTILLNDKINLKGKPFVVCNGTYKEEFARNSEFTDDKIHVVYSGTFSLEKGGAATAIETALFLNKDYHIHIIGFGSEEEKEYLIRLIKEVSKQTECRITYEGCFFGEDYIRFIQCCDIGLSTQAPDLDYNDSSFPSKILSYMSNGLRVVSVRIKAVETSAIASALFFYDQPHPKEIANTIKRINLNEIYDSRNLIRNLDVEFRHNLQSIIRKN